MLLLLFLRIKHEKWMFYIYIYIMLSHFVMYEKKINKVSDGDEFLGKRLIFRRYLMTFIICMPLLDLACLLNIYIYKYSSIKTAVTTNNSPASEGRGSFFLFLSRNWHHIRFCIFSDIQGRSEQVFLVSVIIYDSFSSHYFKALLCFSSLKSICFGLYS